MIDIQNIIENLIEKSLKELGYTNASFVLEHPLISENGDYSTNIAMVLAKNIGKNPRDLAVEILNKLISNKDENIEKIEIAGPGFINFYLSKKFFNYSIRYILDNDKEWGKNNVLKGKKILVEHSSPNLFKPFHIGHVMNNTIGESIKRLAEYGGGNVDAISYPSDVSLGIGKAVYTLMKRGVQTLSTLPNLQSKLAFLGDCYIEGTKLYDEDEIVQKEVRAITQKIFDHTEAEEFDAYTLGKDITLGYFKEITKRLGSEFDDFIYESEAGRVGKELVLSHIEDGIFSRSDGAVIYEGEKDGLHTRVFINKEGNPTYEAKDIGLVSLKFDRFHPDVSIYITDNEQSSYFSVMLSAAGKINPDWKNKSVHRTHGRMTFKGQKMSSRLGGVPTAQDILDDVLLAEVAEHTNKQIMVSLEEDLEAIAVSALKYTILKSQAGKNINFDPKTSLSFEGDSGPYLLYSGVRANSILKKAEDQKIESSTVRPEDLEILELERLLYQFEEVIKHSVIEYAPHHVVTYLTKLAGAFNSFYTNTPILVDNNQYKEYYLSLVRAFYITMKNGLDVLGMKLPSKM